MNPIHGCASLGTTACCFVLAVVCCDPKTNQLDSKELGNAYYAYTGALEVDDAGVASIPARYKWSVETSNSGIDVSGNQLPDSRVMLRLYDPDHNFTAFTAQMDVATAAKLHQELGNIVVKKLQDPGFQHRPQLYRPDQIPTGKIIGVNGDGRAKVILEGRTLVDPRQ